MARPKSEDKRNAILAAATRVFAEEGLAAATARIAKQAGVADGTLFTYFSSKDELLNQLYLELKAELREVMMADYPRDAALEARVRHVWQRYVAWGAANTHKRKTMAQLGMSERVSAESRAQGSAGFADITALQAEGLGTGPLCDVQPTYFGALMGALADVTMEFMAREPASADRYRDAGFAVFWNGITAKT
jgi:AcrR family transcriptional regulator